jgi:hypothetical protein
MPLLTQSFNWKSDRTRNFKKNKGLVVGGWWREGWREWQKGRGVLMTTNMAMVEKPVYPIAIFINELKNDDIQL